MLFLLSPSLTAAAIPIGFSACVWHGEEHAGCCPGRSLVSDKVDARLSPSRYGALPPRLSEGACVPGQLGVEGAAGFALWVAAACGAAASRLPPRCHGEQGASKVGASGD